MAEIGDRHFKLQSERVDVPIADVRDTSLDIFKASGCDTDEAVEVADHLIEADRSGVESHGVLCAASEIGLTDEVDGLMILMYSLSTCENF